MIVEETLRCGVCRQEVRIVRLTPDITALGHVRNPRQNHHPVRLARSGDNAGVRAISLDGQRSPRSEGSDSPDAAGNPSRERTAVPLRSPSVPPSEQGRSQRGPLASSRGSAQSVGRSTAGGRN